MPDGEIRSLDQLPPDYQPARSKHKLRTPQYLPGVERGGETERVTQAAITAPGKARGARSIVRSRQCVGEREYSRGTDANREHLVHSREVRAVKDISEVGTNFDPHRAIGLEAKRLTDPHVDTAVVWPDPGVAADVEKSIRASAGVTVDVRARPQRERNAAADEDTRTQRHVSESARSEVVPGPGFERAL